LGLQREIAAPVSAPVEHAYLLGVLYETSDP